jgi:sporulation protein YlmC with PRC-barrel domain
MKQFVTAIALGAGVALAGTAIAQTSGSSSAPDQPSPSSPAAPASSPAAPSAHAGVLVDASSIIGATVRSQGKDIGKVERLMVDPKDGRVRTVVVQVGGTLGMGGKSVSMPWESVKLAQDGARIIVSAEQMLEPAPAASPPSDSDKKERK